MFVIVKSLSFWVSEFFNNGVALNGLFDVPQFDAEFEG